MFLDISVMCNYSYSVPYTPGVKDQPLVSVLSRLESLVTVVHRGASSGYTVA